MGKILPKRLAGPDDPIYNEPLQSIGVAHCSNRNRSTPCRSEEALWRIGTGSASLGGDVAAPGSLYPAQARHRGACRL
jgi:hypothetical protein